MNGSFGRMGGAGYGAASFPVAIGQRVQERVDEYVEEQERELTSMHRPDNSEREEALARQQAQRAGSEQEPGATSSWFWPVALVLGIGGALFFAKRRG
jgi:hypothetical protein